MSMPTSTYRVQFRDGFDFEAACRIVPYLARLGISHLYASPVMTAVTGSTHGYDVTDYNEIDPALGGREGFDQLCSELRAHGLGLILDIVPNHMAASLENDWWYDVVQWGEQSRYAGHFDIDWSRKLTLPFLGRPLAEVLDEGELSVRLDEEGGSLAIGYFDNRFPLHPGSWTPILAGCSDAVAGQICALAERSDPAQGGRLRQDLKAALPSLKTGGLREELERASRDRSFIEAALDHQPWELIYWKRASRRLSYRRFFEVTGLVGTRVEEERVFDDIHRLTFELVRSGQVDGLRVDHVDGLADPRRYLVMVREAVGPDVHLTVEKILGEDELLPRDWPVSGTTGYEFIDASFDLLGSEEGRRTISEAYEQATGAAPTSQQRRATKTQVATRNFNGELNDVASLLHAAAGGSHEEQDIRAALTELIVAMPVYRTYLSDDVLSDDDVAILRHAAERARERGQAPAEAIDAIISVLTRSNAAGPAREARIRFQQLSGPAMAKGIEDTLFYRDHRLLPLNEVGSEPDRAPLSLDRFHAFMERQAEAAPLALTATSTHDTKRGEDARARLLALTEQPEIWIAAVERWRARHRHLLRELQDGVAPEPEVEWMIYQALAGIWPEDEVDGEAAPNLAQRFLPFLEKALREAKLRTSWTDVDEEYEAACATYAEGLLNDAGFRIEFPQVIRPFIRAGWLNSLAQTAVKLAAPGVPDIYRGTEVADFSLVDPDNRRPLDHALPAAALDLAEAELPPPGWRLKQLLVARVNRLRRDNAAFFGAAGYVPLKASTPHAAAFARHYQDGLLVVVVPRLTMAISDDSLAISPDAWNGHQIDLPADWAGRVVRDVLTGREVALGNSLSLEDAFSERPLAILAAGLASSS